MPEPYGRERGKLEYLPSLYFSPESLCRFAYSLVQEMCDTPFANGSAGNFWPALKFARYNAKIKSRTLIHHFDSWESRGVFGTELLACLCVS